jgi:hypothetical protein
MNRAEAETFPPVSKELKLLRKNLHWAAQHLVTSFGWITKDKIVREVKSIFLWHTYKVETSRALDLDTIREAIHKIKKLNKDHILEHLQARNLCATENDLLKLTSSQRNKLMRIMVYVLKMDKIRQLNYINESVGHVTPIGLLTKTEANILIERVEQWEAKVLLNK